MNIRKTVRNIALTGGAVALPFFALTNVSSAGNPVATGSLGTACTGSQVTWTCTDIVEDTANGFRMEGVESTDGTQYFRTIINEADTVEGGFVMDTYVGKGLGDGISGFNTITDDTAEISGKAAVADTKDGLFMKTTLNHGWAMPGAALSEKGTSVDMGLRDNADEFNMQFGFQETATGEVIQVAQAIGDGKPGTTGTDHQNFFLFEGRGSLLPSHSLTVYDGGTAPVTFDNTTSSDSLRIMWVGSNIGAIFGLEDAEGVAGSATVEAGNDSFATTGFVGTTADTANGYDWDTSLGTTPWQPDFSNPNP